MEKKDKEIIEMNKINFDISEKQTKKDLKRIRNEEEIQKFGKILSPQSRYYYKNKHTEEFKQRRNKLSHNYYHRNKDNEEFKELKRKNALNYYYNKKKNLVK